MNDELKEFITELNYALDKFDWGNSFLDAKAIGILNTWQKKLQENFVSRAEVVTDLKKAYKLGFEECDLFNERKMTYDGSIQFRAMHVRKFERLKSKYIKESK